VSRGDSSLTSYTILQPTSIPRTVARGDDRNNSTAGVPAVGPLCVTNCGSGLPISNILNTDGFNIPKPPPPTRPLHVSEMQLGTLVRKVLPEYPIIAKQITSTGCGGANGHNWEKRSDRTRAADQRSATPHRASSARRRAMAVSSLHLESRASRSADADHGELCAESGMRSN